MKEQDIENNLIDKLLELKYIYRDDIKDIVALHNNFRIKFQELNQVNFTNSEFNRFVEQIITPDVFAAARLLRQHNSFERDDGTPLHYTLVNIKDWCKNTFEFIKQPRVNTDNSYHRYDIILLINGIPVVQIELKTLQISPRRAIAQIIDYKNDIGNGYSKTLLCFIQLFIVSNQNDTWYFANNNNRHFSFDADEKFLPFYQFAKQNNQKITHLHDFAKEFLAKCTLGQMISRYMVLVANEEKLMVMRPYQIYAVKAIVECIHQNCGNGYIWHTTGSGKTLTSFKASTLLKDNEDIYKCLFVVDRKDLDKQTREEFNRFQEGCVEENTNTEKLVQRLLSDNKADKVIVTTIQKLGLALDDNNKRTYKQRLANLRDKRIVFIFDECHRSQFGENHKAIKEFFPKAQLFGFTGTPIFDDNAAYQQVQGEQASYKTTENIFQKQLHAYTITDAIDDHNVLKFHIDYYKPDNVVNPQQILAKKAIIEAILEKHDTATNLRKFNAILATASINDAIEYYRLFESIQNNKKQQDSHFKALNVACVFSPPAGGNKDIEQIQEDLVQEKLDNKKNPQEKKQALQEIIADYNTLYKTNHTINEFDLYYQDVQKRIKDQQYSNQDLAHNQKIDITIVVDMLLTGFDSKFLNTLYADKNLKYHGLIQAFSRTNRILNDTKPYGNIIDFRQQKAEVDTAIELFSGQEQSQKAKEIWLVDAAPKVIDKLKLAVKELDKFMHLHGLETKPEQIANLRGDIARSQFINLFKDVQKFKTQLDQYTNLTNDDKGIIEQILAKDEFRGFKGVYLETAYRLKEKQQTTKNIEPQVQELDFEFVLFASNVIDYDYIMGLMADYSQTTPDKQKMTPQELIALIQSDAKFMNEREDIIAYINTLKANQGLSEKDIRRGYENFKAQKHANELAAIALTYGLEAVSLQNFVDNIIRRMIFDDEQLSELFEPLALGWKARTQKKSELMQDLIPMLNKLANGREISGLKAYE